MSKTTSYSSSKNETKAEKEIKSRKGGKELEEGAGVRLKTAMHGLEGKSKSKKHKRKPHK